MRVAVVSPETSYHRLDDDTDRLERLLVGLAEQGHEVTVLCPRWWDVTGSRPGSPLGDGDSQDAFRTIDGVTYRGIETPEKRREFYLRVPLALASLRPDVIHAVGSTDAILAARIGSTLARAPVVAEWYDATDADGRLWTTRQAAQRVDRTIVPSKLVRRQLWELGANENAVRVVPTGVQMDLIRSVDPVDETQIVYARQLDESANLESLLLGLAELRQRNWSATVIGDGPERERYERQASDLRIDDRLTFAGACDRETRVGIYRGAHVFVQTARRCPFASELLWALACGCVGIVEYHAMSSAHELVEGRDRGFRTTTPDEMADAIQRAGDLEHRTIDDSFLVFDDGEIVERYLDCYQEVQREYGLF